MDRMQEGEDDYMHDPIEMQEIQLNDGQAATIDDFIQGAAAAGYPPLENLAGLSENTPLTSSGAASAFMPTGEQVQKAVIHMDSAIKFEILLTSFHATMKFTSFIEIATVVILAGFFLRSPSAMWFYFFHVLHLIRAIMGIDICSKVPYPQDVIGALRKEAIQQVQSSYTFEEYAAHVE